MRQRAAVRHRVKVSVTVDPELLQQVDTLVAQHADLDRSKVFDAALELWCAQQQEQAMRAQLAEPPSSAQDEERAAWRRIRAAATARRFEPR